LFSISIKEIPTREAISVACRICGAPGQDPCKDCKPEFEARVSQLTEKVSAVRFAVAKAELLKLERKEGANIA
jgi:hypothetical protein